MAGVPQLMRPTWVEVDLDVIADNVKTVRKVVGLDVKIIACLKAKAYGYGSVAVASVLVENGADILAVGNLEQAVSLRQKGITVPVLVFGNTLLETLPYYLQYNLIPTIFDLETAERLSNLATRMHPVYVKVETGLGRLGVNAEEAADLVKRIVTLPRIQVAGIYTHFGPAAGAKDKSYVQWQFRRFTTAIEELEESGIHIPVQQAANSGALVDLPHTYLTAVCPGAALYGMLETAAPKIQCTFDKPFMGVKSRVIQVHKLPAGVVVGGVKLERETTVAVIPIGHSDSFSSIHGNQGEVLVNGLRAMVLGAISLEHTKLDVTEIPGVQVGTEVVLIGRQGKEEITLAEIAEQRGCLEREVLSSMVTRLPYVYYRGGKPMWLSWCFGEQSLISQGNEEKRGVADGS